MQTRLTGDDLQELGFSLLFWDVPGTFPVKRIAEEIVREAGGKRATWERIIPTMQKAYEAAVKRGSPVFKALDRGTYQTAARVTELTGFDLAQVTPFLAALEGLATSGKVDPKYWTPAISAQGAFNPLQAVTATYGGARSMLILAAVILGLWYAGPILRRVSKVGEKR